MQIYKNGLQENSSESLTVAFVHVIVSLRCAAFRGGRENQAWGFSVYVRRDASPLPSGASGFLILRPHKRQILDALLISISRLFL